MALLRPFTPGGRPFGSMVLDRFGVLAHAGVVESTTRWRAAAIGWTAFILIAVAFYQGMAPLQQMMQGAARYEAVHIVAHSILYGTLAGLCVRWLRRVAPAVCVAVCAGAAQEGVQCLFARHAPGGAELFDVTVDTIAAIACALAVAWWMRRRHAFTLHKSLRGSRRARGRSPQLV